jgi:hypothetical protein
MGPNRDRNTHIRRTLLVPTSDESDTSIYASLCDLDDWNTDQSEDDGDAMVQ